jgi:hypothetical protein
MEIKFDKLYIQPYDTFRSVFDNPQRLQYKKC